MGSSQNNIWSNNGTATKMIIWIFMLFTKFLFVRPGIHGHRSEDPHAQIHGHRSQDQDRTAWSGTNFKMETVSLSSEFRSLISWWYWIETCHRWSLTWIHAQFGSRTVPNHPVLAPIGSGAWIPGLWLILWLHQWCYLAFYSVHHWKIQGYVTHKQENDS